MVLLSALMPAATFAQEEDFVCTTFDPRSREPDAGLAAFSATAEGGTIAELKVRAEAAGLSPFGTALIKDIWRRTDGLTPGTGIITLGVYFDEASSRDQRESTELHATKWLEGDLGNVLNFRFGVETRDEAQITITFNTNDNRSEVGRRGLDVTAPNFSMHLSKQTERTVCHEFGHALGLIHEHSNVDAPFVWNEQTVIDEMKQRKWTEADVRSNIFARVGKDLSCLGDPKFNGQSIMLYPIKPIWTADGRSYPLNTKISDGDRNCLVALYRAT
ncbi:M12 family metallopeptidase [Mesorhizobium sp.]|uniref:M12 family metallopeptidase n=1 Tax=Mesorhizobium sp. TaxID=1871066 RepID=UPI0025796964|nr:M12 family metallopeptidase [Mesorhizobium sp.]